MASKNATKTTENNVTSGASGDNRPQFVQYRLNEGEMEQARNAAETFSDVAEILSQFVEEGYKFSCSRDTYGGGVQVFLTPVKRESVNGGLSLTARAPNLIAATAVLCWKHYTLFAQVWPRENVSSGGSTWG